MASKKEQRAPELSQPLVAAPMPEYVFQRYNPTSADRLEEDEQKKDAAGRQIDLSGVVLNLA